MATGKVKWFNSRKGYGFISPEDGGKDVFVHISALEQSGLNYLDEGDQVSFEMPQGIENFRPLKGSAGSSVTLQADKYKTMQLSFSVPRNASLRAKVLKVIYWAHSYEEPVVNIAPELETRAAKEYQKGGRCDNSPNKWYRK